MNTRDDFSSSALSDDLMTANQNGALISLGGGLPASECIPLEHIRAATERVLAVHGSAAMGYTSPAGELQLREWIAAQWLPRHGIQAHPDEILLTHGSQQALDLLGKVFLLPGQTPVALEKPTYLAALHIFRLYRPVLREVPMQTEGPDPAALACALRGNAALHDSHARLFYTIPNFQNPSGVLTTLERRMEMVAELLRHPTLLVEDDPYGELFYDEAPPPSLHALGAPCGALLGTFSKMIAPAFRIGFMRTSRAMAKQLNQVRLATDLCSSRFNQLVLLEVLRSLDLEAHLKRLRSFYRSRRDQMQAALVRHFADTAEWSPPDGGMFFWLQLKAGIRLDLLLAACRARGVVLADGRAFFASGSALPVLRLNFTVCTPEQMDCGIRILADEYQRLQRF